MPTSNYSLFNTAEQLSMSVRQLVTGQLAPLTKLEEYMWRRYRVATARLQQQARPAGKR